ncbi:MAG: hypothetical protein LAT51_11865 [Flavobacteriaceae bacterium]|nr:hypothetical protein [Flavobacteriaceae bacterium]
MQTSQEIQKATEMLNFSSAKGLDLMYIKQEKDSIYYHIMLTSLDGDLYFFDADGNRKCYAGAESCVAYQFIELKDDFKKQVHECGFSEADFGFKFTHLSDFINETTDLQGEKIELDNLPQTDYYFVYHWSKFAGRNKTKREDFEWTVEKIDELGISYTILRVNTNLRTDWGFKKGKKTSLRMKIKKDDDGDRLAEIELGKLPKKSL